VAKLNFVVYLTKGEHWQVRISSRRTIQNGFVQGPMAKIIRAHVFLFLLLGPGLLLSDMVIRPQAVAQAFSAADSDNDGAPDGSETNHGTDPNDSDDWPQPFTDVPNSHPAHSAILWAWDNGIVDGCGPSVFCPDLVMLHSDAVKWVLKSVEQLAYDPPPATGLVYDDVAADEIHAPWIEAALPREITTDCSTTATPTPTLQVLWRDTGRSMKSTSVSRRIYPATIFTALFTTRL